MEKRKIKIQGRVQGVGFRHFTVQNARRLNLNGWVMNMPDGSVEALITGDDEDVSKMMDKLKEGPAAARVDRLEWDSAEPDSLPDTFRVKR
ncbi:acylphosphatase [Rhodohalobacter mucosus]|uniref:Acylphosphatase n=1 Tax=Rhodohalobacter mucosus TaxID=2079485 RepID=A0A316TWI2_9BACT|nr:acylphosphatase [Rhodohalobacter mucosus]PWN07739.1 acylphosphatase [Rhodohalobacter mucosus]